MATILIKRGQQTDLDNLSLSDGELAIAYNTDKSKAEIYVGDGNGGNILLNPTADTSAAVQDAKDYTDEKISGLVDGAPEAMDTLKELADAISANSDIMTALQSAIGDKVDKVTGKGLSSEDYTTEEKTKLSGLSNYTHPSNHEASMITQDSTHRFVTDSEKSEWNNKLSATDTIDGGTF